MEKAIFELLRQGFSFMDIKDKLSLSTEDMALFLDNLNKGIHKRYNHIKFYENGKRRYSFKEIPESGVITNTGSDYYKAVFIADTHFGSLDASPKYLDIVYNFCIQNGIHNIYHLGDVIDGTSGMPSRKGCEPQEQVEFVINKYPNDKSILNFMLFGNHDLDIIGDIRNLHDAVMRNRKDMVCLGYGSNEFFLKNDSIVLKHKILIDKINNNINNKLIFKGHSHQMKVFDDLNNHLIFAPPLSDLQIIDGTIPGFLLVEFGFSNGYINKCVITHYGILDDRLINMNVNRINVNPHTKHEEIQREEVLVKIKK